MSDVACRVVEAEDEVMPLRLARIDAARGIGERIEYEVPMDLAGMSQQPQIVIFRFINTKVHYDKYLFFLNYLFIFWKSSREGVCKSGPSVKAGCASVAAECVGNLCQLQQLCCEPKRFPAVYPTVMRP